MGQQLSIRMDDEVDAAVRAEAKKYRRSLNAQINWWLELGMKAAEAQKELAKP